MSARNAFSTMVTKSAADMKSATLAFVLHRLGAHNASNGSLDSQRLAWSSCNG